MSTALATAAWAPIRPTSLPVAVFQKRSVLSLPLLASSWPLELKETLVTAPLWPVRMENHAQDHLPVPLHTAKGFDVPAGSCIPQLRRIVPAAGGDKLAVRTES